MELDDPEDLLADAEGLTAILEAVGDRLAMRLFRDPFVGLGFTVFRSDELSLRETAFREVDGLVERGGVTGETMVVVGASER